MKSDVTKWTRRKFNKTNILRSTNVRAKYGACAGRSRNKKKKKNTRTAKIHHLRYSPQAIRDFCLTRASLSLSLSHSLTLALSPLLFLTHTLSFSLYLSLFLSFPPGNLLHTCLKKGVIYAILPFV